MKSITSYFSISPALIGENLRRFWTIPAFSFLFYLFFCILTMMTVNEGRTYSVESLLEQGNILFLGLNLVFPVIASIVLFRYLHTAGSVSVMHAMPFSRQKLFNSNFVSGLILLLAPVLVTGILIMCYMPHMADLANMAAATDFRPPATGSEQLVNLTHTGGWPIYSVWNVLNWMGTSFVMILFIFAICVLAGIVTGNIPLHLMICGFLNGLLPALLLLSLFYCTRFLFGFTEGSIFNSISNLSPLSAFSAGEAVPGALTVIVYLLASAAVIWLAAFLYSKRSLERAGDSFTYKWMGILVCFFSAFAGMTIMALYLADVGGEAFFPVGLVSGALLAFFIARMIVKKTPRIWNRETFAQLGIYGIIMVLFIGCFQFDLSGYEKRVPAAAKVDSISINSNSYPFSRNGRIYYWDGASNGDFVFKNPENIKAITDVHGKIVSNRQSLRSSASRLFPAALRYGAYAEHVAFNANLRLDYHLANNSEMRRFYQFPGSFLKSEESMRKVIASDEYRSMRSILDSKRGNLTSVRLNSMDYYSDIYGFTSGQMSALAAAVDKDLRAETYEQIAGYAKPWFYIEFEFEDTAKPLERKHSNVRAGIPFYFTNTVSWLKENGYYDQLAGWISETPYIRMEHYGGDESANELGWMDNLGTPVEFRDAVNVYEADRIMLAFENAEEATAGNDYWIVRYNMERDPEEQTDADLTADQIVPVHAVRGEGMFYLSSDNPALEVLLQ